MISVAIAYYNRKKHLINSLLSMTKSNYKNFEVIVVDDGSNENQRIEDLTKQFNFLKVIRINIEEKKHINPCIPLNIAISNTIGDIIVIQNPECFHYNDVFLHTINNIAKNTYLAYSVVNKDIVNALQKINWNNNYSFEINKLININIGDGNNQWYTHRIFRPEALNFCTAIMRDDLVELNGFDERYAYGVERDDVEFLERIKRKRMNIIFVDSVIAIHQSHNLFFEKDPQIYSKLRNINHSLYAKTTAIENIIKANPNKIILQ